MRLSDCSISSIQTRLASTGIGLAFGPYQFCVRSKLKRVATSVSFLYGDCDFREPCVSPDFDLEVFARRHFQRSVVYTAVNGQLWNSWPRPLTAAAVEWVTNWCFFNNLRTEYLALHAGAVELPSGEGAVMLPGVSGAGKSTLSATLMLSGWRLLSDEVALVDMREGTLTGLGRSVILKGDSIDLIRKNFPAQASFGVKEISFETADEGVSISHLRPMPASRNISGSKFKPLAFFFPKRRRGAEPSLRPLSQGDVFSSITQHGLSFRQKAKPGFDAACQLTLTCPGFELEYENAVDAEAYMRDLSKSGSLMETISKASAGDKKRAWGVSGRTDLGRTGGRLFEKFDDEKAGKINYGTSPQGQLQQSVQSSTSISSEWALGTLSRCLRSPAVLLGLSVAEWSRVSLLGNHLQVLGQLAARVRLAGLEKRVAPEISQRLKLPVQQAEFTKSNIGFELLHLRRIATRAGVAPVLLKGAAYLASGSRCGRGRTTRDVDMLVSERKLDRFVAEMSKSGYSHDPELAKDHLAYYRKWLHEVPAMTHSYRRFEVDLHFRLLPQCDPLSFSCDEFIERATRYEGETVFRVLDPIDQVIHAIINLGRCGEFQRGFRDTWDLCCLVEGSDPLTEAASSSFNWEEFTRRVASLRLGKIAAYILALTVEFHSADVPESVIEGLGGVSRQRLSRTTLYRTMRTAALPSDWHFYSRNRRIAMRAMLHYPLPRAKTWLDPLTWTKRISFLRDA